MYFCFLVENGNKWWFKFWAKDSFPDRKVSFDFLWVSSDCKRLVFVEHSKKAGRAKRRPIYKIVFVLDYINIFTEFDISTNLFLLFYSLPVRSDLFHKCHKWWFGNRFWQAWRDWKQKQQNKIKKHVPEIVENYIHLAQYKIRPWLNFVFLEVLW